MWPPDDVVQHRLCQIRADFCSPFRLLDDYRYNEHKLRSGIGTTKLRCRGFKSWVGMSWLHALDQVQTDYASTGVGLVLEQQRRNWFLNAERTLNWKTVNVYRCGCWKTQSHVALWSNSCWQDFKAMITFIWYCRRGGSDSMARIQ